MQVFLKSIVAAAIVLVLSYGLYLGLKSEHFIVTKVSFDLMDNKDPSYIFPKIKSDIEPRAKALLGKYIWKLDLETLVSVLEKDQRLKDLKVVRKWPNEIQIEVRPHHAVANILNDRSDAIYPLSADGSVFPAMGLDEVTDAPILRGNIFLKDAATRKMVIQILNALPKEGSFSLQSVSEIYYDQNLGFVLVLGPENNQVILGREDFQKRISYISRVVDYLKSEDLRNRVIDSRFQKKVVVRPRNAS